VWASRWSWVHHFQVVLKRPAGLSRVHSGAGALLDVDKIRHRGGRLVAEHVIGPAGGAVAAMPNGKDLEATFAGGRLDQAVHLPCITAATAQPGRRTAPSSDGPTTAEAGNGRREQFLALEPQVDPRSISYAWERPVTQAASRPRA